MQRQVPPVARRIVAVAHHRPMGKDVAGKRAVRECPRCTLIRNLRRGEGRIKQPGVFNRPVHALMISPGHRAPDDIGTRRPGIILHGIALGNLRQARLHIVIKDLLVRPAASRPPPNRLAIPAANLRHIRPVGVGPIIAQGPIAGDGARPIEPDNVALAEVEGMAESRGEWGLKEVRAVHTVVDEIDVGELGSWVRRPDQDFRRGPPIATGRIPHLEQGVRGDRQAETQQCGKQPETHLESSCPREANRPAHARRNQWTAAAAPFRHADVGIACRDHNVVDDLLPIADGGIQGAHIVTDKERPQANRDTVIVDPLTVPRINAGVKAVLEIGVAVDFRPIDPDLRHPITGSLRRAPLNMVLDGVFRAGTPSPDPSNRQGIVGARSEVGALIPAVLHVGPVVVIKEPQRPLFVVARTAAGKELQGVPVACATGMRPCRVVVVQAAVAPNAPVCA
jgi:hypothetical protein